MPKLLLRYTCALIMSACAALWAQSVSGTLTGRITSAEGNPVPNAAITVTNTQTNTSQKGLTGPDGTFSITGLPPGTYNVDVESSGYKRTSQQAIELTATGPTQVNITLETGNINETVQIKGTAPMTQSDNGEVSLGIDTRVIQEIPNIDRNHQQFVQFETGITPPEAAIPFPMDPDRNRFFSTNGQSPFLNQWYLDGFLNTEPYRNTAIRVVPTDMIQQFNVSTANLQMDKGFTGGTYAVDNSRGGTNTLHGDLFEFYSGNPLRTRSFFDTVDTNSPRFVYNQFGATVGGPIVKDKIFFFGSYEGQFNSGYNTTISTVPVNGALTGDFSGIPGLTVYNPFTGNSLGTGRTAFAGGVIPAGDLNPTSLAIASFIPAPNAPGLVNNLVSNQLFRLNYQKGGGRIDDHMSDRTSAFLRYGYTNNYSSENSPLGPVISEGIFGRILSQNAAIGLDHAFNDHLITSLKFAYNRYDLRLQPNDSDQSALAAALGVSSFPTGLIGINIPGMPLIGSNATIPEEPVDNTFNWVWDWSLHTARHSFKWGVDIRRIRADGWLNQPLLPQFGPSGTAYFGPGATLSNDGTPLSAFSEFYNSYAAFLLGAPSQVGVVSDLISPTIRQSQYGFWLGDNVHLMPHLTLDLGVRYELWGAIGPANSGAGQIYDPTTNSFNYSGIGGTPMDFTVRQTTNLAPRIGLAWSLNDRTVIRGGYGIQYFQMPYQFSGLLPAQFGAVAGVQGTYAVAPGIGTFGPTLTTTVPPPATLANGAFAGTLPAYAVQRNLPTPYVQTFSLQVQRDFYYGSVLSIGYVGMLDRHLPYSFNSNFALPGTGVAGLPLASLGQTSTVQSIQSGLTSNYNSLQVSLNKRFSQGIAFMAAYTYSKALGYTNELNQILNPLDLRSNYGPLDFDRTQQLNLTHLWEIPWGRHGNSILSTLLGGWQLNGVLTWVTGTPFTFTADPLLCNCPGLTPLAGAFGNSGLTTGAFGNGASFFNSSAFFTPVGTNFGGLNRGVLRGPTAWTYNLGLMKNFHVHDRFNFEVRAEAYNLSNTVSPFISPLQNVNSPSFGVSTSPFADNGALPGAFGRMIKFGGQLSF
ncbi:MAG TPA: TonB-dependent receptor [Bryobacteraceae bacterium]|nr:TonB-dependent receptor [Bryobacteraceae bacterium]